MASTDSNIVLVVDDDLGMLKSVQRLLRLHAYEPVLFSSAKAFECDAHPDRAGCIILDINLPDGSGIELRHRLKEDGVSAPVIFMTGNQNPVARDAAVASGCIAFLTKPFSAQSLLEPLKEAMAGRS
jgi:FixJ family two-component response regulator